MVGYNLTSIGANSTSLLTLTQQVNSVLMLGWYGTIFLIGLAAVLFMSFMWATNDTARSLAATSALCAIFSLFLAGVGLIGPFAFFVCVIFFAVMVAFSWRKD